MVKRRSLFYSAVAYLLSNLNRNKLFMLKRKHALSTNEIKQLSAIYYARVPQIYIVHFKN